MWYKEFPTVRKRYFSQTGEDGILEYIFNNIGTTNKVCVEFGAWDGVYLSNTKYFRDNGWSEFLFDAEPKSVIVHKEIITVENINHIFANYKIPKKFDLLSIDVDGNDYWLWKALEYSPRVVVIELNPNFNDARTIKYDPAFRFGGNNYYGGSPLAMKKLGKEKGYTMVHHNIINGFFVRNDIIGKNDLDISLPHKILNIEDSAKREWVYV